MHPFLAEFLGTMLLVLLGDGVVANVLLRQTKGHASGWMPIAIGWAAASTVAVYAVNTFSGAHLNPAVTLGLASTGRLAPALVPEYLAGQGLGAFLGAVLVWLAYLPHWRATQDPAVKLSVFATIPAIRDPLGNFLCEAIGTAVLVLGILAVQSSFNHPPGSGLESALGPALVGCVVLAIGLSLGGPTGHAINPARDLGPRVAHSLLPIPGKGPSDWGYAWVPVLGPMVGGTAGAWLHKLLWLHR